MSNIKDAVLYEPKLLEKITGSISRPGIELLKSSAVIKMMLFESQPPFPLCFVSNF